MLNASSCISKRKYDMNAVRPLHFTAYKLHDFGCKFIFVHSVFMISGRAVPNILFVFYSVRIVGRIAYSYSAE